MTATLDTGTLTRPRVRGKEELGNVLRQDATQARTVRASRRRPTHSRTDSPMRNIASRFPLTLLSSDPSDQVTPTTV